MSFVQILLLSCVYILAISATGTTKTAELSKKTPSIFDIVFNRNALDEYGEQISKDIEEIQKEACYLKNKEDNFEFLSTQNKNILKCMRVNERHLRIYFKKHDQDEFEADFNKDLMKCISGTSISTKVMNCYVNTIFDYLQEIKDNDKYVSSKKAKECIRTELNDYLTNVNINNGKLKKCLSKIENQTKLFTS